MTIEEMQEYLTEIDEARSSRTLRRWIKGYPAISDTRPKKYDTAGIAEIFFSHNITQLRHDYQRKKHGSEFDNDSQSLKDEFDKEKEELIFKFLLEQLGYHFNEHRLQEDLANRQELKRSISNNIKLKPSQKSVLIRSVNRLKKHETNYYFRKVRTKKKKP